MNELVQVTEQKINGIDMIQAVDARELHTFLGVGRDFTNWIKTLIEKYDFEEGMDFSPKRARSEAGRIMTEYAISLDMAKEIGMLAKSTKGKEIRKYFIECERKLQHQIPQTYTEALRIALQQAEENDRLQLELNQKDVVIEQQTPIVEEYNTIINDTNQTYTVTEMARGLGLTNIALNKLLCSRNIQYKVGKNYKLYAKYEGNGYTKDTTAIYNDHICITMKWTQKGYNFVKGKLDDQLKHNTDMQNSEKYDGCNDDYTYDIFTL